MANLTVKKSIIDLYVAYFNRVPDYEGYQYWIEQYDLGSSLTDISNEFYKAGATQFSAETGYSIGMSKEAFIRQLYDGILDRGPTSSLAPNATEVAYWVSKLDGLNGDKGALVLQMIKEIRDFDATNNAAIKEVQDKFNNKMYASFLLLEDPAGAEDIYGAYDFGETAYAGGPALTPEEKIALGKQVLTTITADVASIDETITKFVATLKAPEVEPEPEPEPEPETPVTEKTVGLSVYTDVVTANQFNAGMEYTPGGNDRVNTLQDEDKLTGVGVNPKLIAEVGNANDNGGTTITPFINGVKDFAFSFTGSSVFGAVNTIDMQDVKADGGIDRIEISRIANGPNVATLTNINLGSVNPESPEDIDLSIKKTRADANVNLLFTDAYLNSTAGDNANLFLNEVNLDSLVIEGVGGDVGFETIHVQSGSSAAGPNVIDSFVAEDLQTLYIDHNTGDGGDNALTIGNGATITDITQTITGIAEQGSLRTIDGSGFEANLDLTIVPGTFNANLDGTATDTPFTLSTGSGDDIIRVFNDTFAAAPIDLTKGVIGTNDAIHANAGTDTLALASAVNVNFLADSTSPALTPNNQADTAQVDGVDIVTVTRLANAGVIGTAELVVDMNQMLGDQAVVLQNMADANDGVTTFTLHDLSAAEAAAIAIKHSNNTNNGIADTVINVATALEGQVDTVGVEIQSASNNDARFNFTLNTDAVTPVVPATTPVTYQKAITNLTITDSDSETNTVQLDDAADYTGTVTIKGGSAGTTLNLDAFENALGLDLSGVTAGDLFTGTAAGSMANTPGSNAGALVASVVDASAAVSNVVVRLGGTNATTPSTAAQTVTMGSGNDLVIMDTLNESHAGLTNIDTLNGGAGTDTLALGGNVMVSIGQTEWQNVSNFEVIRLLGNDVVATPGLGVPGAYNLTLTDTLISNNGVAQADGSRLIAIVNDNDTANDTANAANTAGTGVERSAVIDATALSVNRNFSYNGEEGVSATTDRFILSDSTVNGRNSIDGGALDTSNLTWGGNLDVMEVRGQAVVSASAGDLTGMKNIGTLEFTNPTTLPVTSTLELTSAAIDALVDSYHTASATEVEVLNVLVGDNVNLQLDTTGVDGTKFAVNVTGSAGVNGITTTTLNDNIFAGAGDDVVNSGAGDDFVQAGAGNDTVNAGIGADVVFGDTGNDILNGEDGDDYLDGDADNDTLNGGAGADTLIGDVGVDTLTGGADADLFQFFTGDSGITLATADTITDFQFGVDQIYVDVAAGTALNYFEGTHAGFAASLAAANFDFTNFGTTFYFSEDTVEGMGLLFIDTNADGAAEEVIQLTGVTLATFDFTSLI
ncbi:beta strand repeat-containing protein [Thiothrix nivea]|uniref:Hemolysin-type calcium-binding region n=1 Tax=Thiothrix nivea (strain ATCC 35100 / DSM 5205 / JP2) TaxID=870187 RepID=A0A656HGD9_THINJ|nr:hypothetical protein [Thiothrix nivea]EIJ34259.1 Hemolysin-type calcium-binding region [Thiothrix nivea DSM 5205]